jgi:hypothetical protein
MMREPTSNGITPTPTNHGTIQMKIEDSQDGNRMLTMDEGHIPYYWRGK